MNYQDIKNEVYLFTGTNSGTFLDDDVNRSFNNWYRRVDSWIWNASKVWEFDDSNRGDLQIAVTDLVHEQQDYEMPSTARTIERVEIKNSGGDWQLLKPIDKTQIKVALPEYKKEPGLPVEYDLMGRSLFLYPPPNSANVTLTEGLRIHVSRDIEEFSTTALTAIPGFDNHFHRILSLGISLDWAIANDDQPRKTDFTRLIFGGGTTQGLKKELEEFYSKRAFETRPRIQPIIQNYK